MGSAYAGEGAIAADADHGLLQPRRHDVAPRHAVRRSGFAVYTRSHFQNRGSHFSEEVGGGPIPGINGGNGGGFALLPTFFLTHQFQERVSVGIGMSAPFGLETDWDARLGGTLPRPAVAAADDQHQPVSRRDA